MVTKRIGSDKKKIIIILISLNISLIITKVICQCIPIDFFIHKEKPSGTTMDVKKLIVLNTKTEKYPLCTMYS